MLLSTYEYVIFFNKLTIEMDSCDKNNVTENAEINDLQKIDTKIKPRDQSDEKEKLVTELIEMGFAKSLVLQVSHFHIFVCNLYLNTSYNFFVDCRQCRRCTKKFDC